MLVAGFVGSDHCPVSLELLPDPSDPPQQNQAQSGREGCEEKGGMRNTQTQTEKGENVSLPATLRKTSEEEEVGEGGEEVLRDDGGVPSDGASFMQQGIDGNVPEPSATREGVTSQMGGACVTPRTRRSSHSGTKSASGCALPVDDETSRDGRTNTRSGMDDPGVDILLKEPRKSRNIPSAQSRDFSFCVKKARREEDGFEGVVPDAVVMNSGGFFR